MFKQPPHFASTAERSITSWSWMDHYGIAKGMVGVGNRGSGDLGAQAVQKHPRPFFGSWRSTRNRGHGAVRDLQRAHDELGHQGRHPRFPAGLYPQVRSTTRSSSRSTAKCGRARPFPICVCAGVPGTAAAVRPPVCSGSSTRCAGTSRAEVVTRHGCEPLADLAAKRC